MRSSTLVAMLLTVAGLGPSTVLANDVAPGGTLRAAYLGTNPAQAVRDPVTGEVRGTSYDLARELARRIGVPLDFKPIAGPPAVIEAVRSGAADIGFVAYEATRLGTVEFSQTYLLVQQSFLVPGDSTIQAVGDVDRAGQRIAGTRNDSMALCLKRTLKQATLVELENKPEVLVKAMGNREIDALGANRQRLTSLMKELPGSRLLPDDLFNVPQSVIVPMGKPAALAAVNAFIDDVRASGLLREAVARSGAVGVAAAPASPGSAHGCPN